MDGLTDPNHRKASLLKRINVGNNYIIAFHHNRIYCRKQPISAEI